MYLTIFQYILTELAINVLVLDKLGWEHNKKINCHIIELLIAIITKKDFKITIFQATKKDMLNLMFL